MGSARGAASAWTASASPSARTDWTSAASATPTRLTTAKVPSLSPPRPQNNITAVTISEKNAWWATCLCCCTACTTGVLRELVCPDSAFRAAADCNGVFGGDSVEDACSVCGGSNACFDCGSVPFGPNRLDRCATYKR